MSLSRERLEQLRVELYPILNEQFRGEVIDSVLEVGIVTFVRTYLELACPNEPSEDFGVRIRINGGIVAVCLVYRADAWQQPIDIRIVPHPTQQLN